MFFFVSWSVATDKISSINQSKNGLEDDHHVTAAYAAMLSLGGRLMKRMLMIL